MQSLLTITEQDFDIDTPAIKLDACALRRAARAVLLDEQGQVYLMRVSKHGYHKLPGGGIDEGESPEQALARELIEEVGCKATITHEVGQITEFRTIPWEGSPCMKQISYCYITTQVGIQGESALEEGELAEGMTQIKAASIAEAVRTLRNDQPDNLEGKFIQKRDLEFLKQAQMLLAA